MDSSELPAPVVGVPELKIDLEFQRLCFPLTKEEFEQLEANVLAEKGCRDPLVLWNGTILDGHNRYEICKRHGLTFQTVEAKGVVSRQDAIAWIVTNQLGRRNLTPEQAAYLRGQRYNLEKTPQGEERIGGKSCHRKTAEKLADEFKVGARTIRNDAAFAAAVDTLATTVGPAFRDRVLTRGSRVTRGSVIELAALSPERQIEKAREIEAEVSPKKRPIKRRLQPKPPKGFLAPKSTSRSASTEAAPAAPPPTADSASFGQVFKSFDEIPSGKYRCLYMAPPWERPHGNGGSAETARPVVSNAELASLDLARICHPAGAHLWIWTTWWLLRYGFTSNLLKKWGFTWDSEVVWVKETPENRAHFLKPMTEVLLLAKSKCGNLGVRDDQTLALLTGPPDATGKPEGTHDLVTRCTSGPRIELFAFSPRADWESFMPDATLAKNVAQETAPVPAVAPVFTEQQVA
jgi:N6-adenosine-specific RNA methylase IME4